MPTIKVNTSSLGIYESEMKEILSRVNSIMSEFNSVSSRLDWDIRSESNINSRLNIISKELSAESRGISGMQSHLGKAIKKYDAVDNSNKISKVDGENASNTSPIGSGLNTDLYIKELAKVYIDVFGKAGDLGKIAAFQNTILKILLDDNGLSNKDIGSLLKSAVNSVIGIIDLKQNSGDISKLFGLNGYKTINAAAANAGWVDRVGKGVTSGLETFKSNISPIAKNVDGSIDKLKTGTKVAGWVASLVANGFANYDEYSKGDISEHRAVAETVTETIIDIGKSAAIAAGIAAGCAAVGFAAPVVVVGGISVGVSAVADIVSKNLTGKGVTELASDTILDFSKSAGKTITGTATNAKNAVSGWFNKLVSQGGYNMKYLVA